MFLSRKKIQVVDGYMKHGILKILDKTLTFERTVCFVFIPDFKLLAIPVSSSYRFMGDLTFGILAEKLVLCVLSCGKGLDISVDLERAWTWAVCGLPQVNMNLTWVPSRLPKAKRKLNLWVESSLPGILGQDRSGREAFTMFSVGDWHVLSQRSKGLKGPFAAL